MFDVQYRVLSPQFGGNYGCYNSFGGDTSPVDVLELPKKMQTPVSAKTPAPVKIKQKFVPEYPGQMSPKTLKQFEKTKNTFVKYFENHYDTFDGEMKAQFDKYDISFLEPKNGQFHLNVSTEARGVKETTTYALDKSRFDRIWKSQLGQISSGDFYHSSAPPSIKTLEETKDLNKLLRQFFKALKKVR